MMPFTQSASVAFLETLYAILTLGATVTPRGKETRELQHHTIAVDMNRPLVACSARRLSKKFAAAEALWILRGDNRVEPLAKHAPRIREFSDDGETLAGAYGPRVVEQLDYVYDRLLKDSDTRQAVLTMWKPCPPPSKDIPCTVALDFKRRAGRLNCHAFMRSSDAWLGLPYDVFSFSMIAARIATRLNSVFFPARRELVTLGTLYLTASSSHLYAENVADARALIGRGAPVDEPELVVPPEPLAFGNPDALEEFLTRMEAAP